MPDTLDTKHFYLRRLHSLLGVLPVSLFLIEHMLANGFILIGPKAYNQLIEVLEHLPYLVTIEVLFIGLPIAYHAIYGIYISLTASTNVQDYGYLRNWLYFLQRVSGIVALVFIIYHVWEFRIATEFYDFKVSYEVVGQAMRVPWIFWFYVIGMAGTMFHFGNGLWLFCITWGITITPRAQQVTGFVFTCAGLALFVLGVWTITVVGR